MPLSASQLVTLACQICKVPGYRQQAGQLLNLVLQDLAQVYDFDTERKETSFSLVGGVSAYTLPADHLRTREVFYNINGAVTFLTQVSMEEYDALFTGIGNQNYPLFFASKVEADPHQLLIWPNNPISVPMVVKYQPTPDDIISPETNNSVPWFPNQNVLLKKLNAAVSMLAEDDRMVSFDGIADRGLSKFLTMSDDKEGYVRQVKLDRRSFRPAGARRATKTQPV